MHEVVEKFGSEQAARVMRRADQLNAAVDGVAERRLRSVAAAARGTRKKLFWLQRASDLVGQAATKTGVAPCKTGCAHCCHQSVQMTRAEAEEIARVSGREISTAPARSYALREMLRDEDGEELLALREGAAQAYTGKPCPFLNASKACSIYEARPLTCRLHLSLADDDGPCKLSGEQGGQTGAWVPYVDVTMRQVASLSVLGLNQVIADVRDWFPEKSGGDQALPLSRSRKL